MALRNVARALDLAVPVIAAYTLTGRLAGLFALDQHAKEHAALHISPCPSIHTFALSHPIDVLFLNKQNVIVKICPSLAPNRIVAPSGKPYSVLEAMPGVLPLEKFQVGEQLLITAETHSRPTWFSFSKILHIPLNIFLAIFWLLFVMSSWQTFRQHHSWLGFGLLIFNSLVVFFFLFRRKSTDTSHNFWDWLIPPATVALSMMLRINPTNQPFLQNVSLFGQGLGLLAILYSLLCLGKSFGIVPANRTVKIKGAYTFIRHPLYASEAFFYLSFLAGHFNWFNLLKIFLIFLGQLWRIRSEECVLNRDQRYREYCRRVPHRLWPGIF